jgi:hypothetical protein
MPTINLDRASVIDIPLETPAPIDGFFLFGIHKCGSSLLNKLFVDICRILDIPSVAIPELAFAQSIPTESWDACTALNSAIVDGYCHRGYRHFPLFLNESELLPQRKKIFLVRDPRDAIVSAYFSFTKSHVLPESGELLDKMLKSRQSMQNIELENYAVAQAANVKEAFDRYHKYLPQGELLKVYRYEDVIFDKENWIADMLAFLGLSLRPPQIVRIAQKHDIVPTTEDAGQHIRKVKPGDHREKLSSECILKINNILSEVLTRYNYEH